MLDSVDAAALKFSQSALERCATPMLQRKFVLLGGVDMLLHFLSMSVHDEVIVSAATALRMLAESNTDTCVRVLQQGSVSALLVQLRRTRNVQVLRPILGVLRAVVETWCAASDEPWADEPLVDADDDSVELIVKLLAQHPKHSSAALPPSSRAVSKSQTVVKGEQSLGLEAAAVLYHLCTHEYDIMVRAGEVGAVAELVTIVKRSMHEPEVGWAVKALCVLVAHQAHQDKFGAADGHVVLVTLLRTTQFGDVAEQAAHTLSNYMCGRKAQLLVAAADGAEALVSVLVKALGSPPFQVEELMVQTCACLCNFTFENDANRIKVGQVGGCQVLVRVCSMSQSYVVLEQACAAIGNVCKKNRTNRTFVGQSGGCEILLRVLSLSPPEGTAVQAVRAIGNVALMSPDNQLRLAAGNALHLLLGLIETLSLRLSPDVTPTAPHTADTAPQSAASFAQRASNDVSAGREKEPSGRQPTPARSSGRGGVMQHEESFLHVTLTALSALAAHECCRNQLACDTASARLLQRVVRLAVWPETRSAASRLLAALHPPLHVKAEGQSPAESELALQCDACNSGGDETALAAVAVDTACPLPRMVHAAPPPATASAAAAPPRQQLSPDGTAAATMTGGWWWDASVGHVELVVTGDPKTGTRSRQSGGASSEEERPLVCPSMRGVEWDPAECRSETAAAISSSASSSSAAPAEEAVAGVADGDQGYDARHEEEGWEGEATLALGMCDHKMSADTCSVSSSKYSRSSRRSSAAWRSSRTSSCNSLLSLSSDDSRRLVGLLVEDREQGDGGDDGVEHAHNRVVHNVEQRVHSRRSSLQEHGSSHSVPSSCESSPGRRSQGHTVGRSCMDTSLSAEGSDGSDSYSALFSEDDDELDVEIEAPRPPRHAPAVAMADLQATAVAAGVVDSVQAPPAQVEAEPALRASLPQTWRSRGDAGTVVAAVALQAAGSAAAAQAMGVEDLVEKTSLRLSMDGMEVPPPFSEAEGRQPFRADETATRARPDRRERQESLEREQKQRVVDAWLEAAEALQSKKVAIEDMRLRRRASIGAEALAVWRGRLDTGRQQCSARTVAVEAGGTRGMESVGSAEAVNASEVGVGGPEDSDDSDGEAAMESAHDHGTACVVRGGADLDADVFAREEGDGAGALAGSERASPFGGGSRTIDIEDAFSSDARAAPSLPGLPYSATIGSSVDGMTVASEASTRSLGSEQSVYYSGEQSGELSVQACWPYEPCLPQPGPQIALSGGSAEDQLDASTRAMQSMLTQGAKPLY